MNSRLAALKTTEEFTWMHEQWLSRPRLRQTPQKPNGSALQRFHVRGKVPPSSGSIPHTQQLYPKWETSQYCAFSSFYFYTFFCIKKKSIITTNYKGLKQD